MVRPEAVTACVERRGLHTSTKKKNANSSSKQQQNTLPCPAPRCFHQGPSAGEEHKFYETSTHLLLARSSVTTSLPLPFRLLLLVGVEADADPDTEAVLLAVDRVLCLLEAEDDSAAFAALVLDRSVLAVAEFAVLLMSCELLLLVIVVAADAERSSSVVGCVVGLPVGSIIDGDDESI